MAEMDFDSMPNDSQSSVQQTAQSPQPEPLGAADQGPAQTGHTGLDFDSLQDDSEKYSTPEQQFNAGLEGAAQGIIGPLAPLAETKMLGIDPAEIRARETANPFTHGISQGVGLVTSALSGVGEAGILAKIGEGAKAAVGLGELGAGASLMHKAAAGAVSQAAEFAALASGDETSRMILKDPDQSAQSALANIGLSTALGGLTGGFMSGVVSPLWKATAGSKLEGALQSIEHDQVSGINGAIPDQTMRPVFEKTLAAMGGTTPEAIQDYLANYKAIQEAPQFEDIYQHGLDHIGEIGDNLNKSKTAYNDLRENMMSDFRERGADAKAAKQMADFSLKDAQTKLASDIQDRALDSGKLVSQGVENLRQSVVDQSAKAYDLLDANKKNIPLDGFYNKAEKLAKNLEAQGTIEAQSQADRLRQYATSIQSKFGTGVLAPEAKPLIQGLDKVSKYDFNATAFDKGLNGSYKELRSTLDEALKDAVPEYRAAMKPLAKDTQFLSELRKYGTPEEATSAIRGLKNEAKYKTEMPMLKQLEERTGMQFTQDIEPYANKETRAALEEALPEFKNAQDTAAALDRLKHPETKAILERVLAESEQAKALEAAHLAKSAIPGITENTLQGKLKSAMTPGKNIAVEKALTQFPEFKGKSVPEMLNLLRMKEAFEKNATRGSKHVNMYGAIVGGLAGAVHAMGHTIGIPTGAIVGSLVDAHGPELIKSMLDKYMTKFGNLNELAKEGAKDSSKTLLSRILGANMSSPNSESFKAGVDYISNIKKGVQATKDTADAIFKSGSTQLIRNRPTDSDRDKLDNLVTKFQDSPGNLVQYMQQSKVGHYLPDHGGSLSKSATAATQYLQQIKPKPFKPSPLDKEIAPSKSDITRYNRALDIANNPLLVLEHAKNGTIQPSDIQDIHSMYPALYQQMCQQVTAAIIRREGNEETIPYKTRLGVSLLLGQALDSSMTPASIIAAQPIPTPPPQQQSPGGNKGGKSTSKLGKTNSSYQTTTQSAESDRTNRS